MTESKGIYIVAKQDPQDPLESLIDRLGQEDRERLAALLFEQLSADKKARLFGKEIKEAGLVVVMGGGNCTISSDISQIIEALAELKRRD